MQITYLSNSGFLLEQDDEALIFDCYNPKKQTALRDEALLKKSAVTAFVSHVHGDHYSPDIWKLAGAQFVVSFDVPAPGELRPRVTVLHPGESAAVNGIRVRAYGSTDEGISFYVQWREHAIFHAGDLNDWHWRDESDEAYVRQAEEHFLRELARIRENEQPPLLAFFPVDPRMGTDYYRGAILFAKTMRPKYFIPMHFGGRFAPPQAFFEEIAPYTELLAPPEMGRSIKVTI